jgi:hypothetical protein
MATRQDFTSGQVLTAEELDAVATAMIAINAQTGTTYTTVLSDDGKLLPVQMRRHFRDRSTKLSQSHTALAHK